MEALLTLKRETGYRANVFPKNLAPQLIFIIGGVILLTQQPEENKTLSNHKDLRWYQPKISKIRFSPKKAIT